MIPRAIVLSSRVILIQVYFNNWWSAAEDSKNRALKSDAKALVLPRCLMEKSLWTDLPGPQSSAAATISAKSHAMGLRILVYSDTEKIFYISIRLITAVRDLGSFMEPDDFHKETCQMKGTVTAIEI